MHSKELFLYVKHFFFCVFKSLVFFKNFSLKWLCYKFPFLNMIRKNNNVLLRLFVNYVKVYLSLERPRKTENI